MHTYIHMIAHIYTYILLVKACASSCWQTAITTTTATRWATKWKPVGRFDLRQHHRLSAVPHTHIPTTHPTLTHAHMHPAVRGSHVNVMQTPSPSVPLPIAVLLYVSQLAISFFVYVSRFACDIIINKIKAKWKCCCCCCLCCFCCCLCCRCPRWCISAGLQCDLRR